MEHRVSGLEEPPHRERFPGQVVGPLELRKSSPRPYSPDQFPLFATLWPPRSSPAGAQERGRRSPVVRRKRTKANSSVRLHLPLPAPLARIRIPPSRGPSQDHGHHQTPHSSNGMTDSCSIVSDGRPYPTTHILGSVANSIPGGKTPTTTPFSVCRRVSVRLSGCPVSLQPGPRRVRGDMPARLPLMLTFTSIRGRVS